MAPRVTHPTLKYKVEVRGVPKVPISPYLSTNTTHQQDPRESPYIKKRDPEVCGKPVGLARQCKSTSRLGLGFGGKSVDPFGQPGDLS